MTGGTSPRDRDTRWRVPYARGWNIAWRTAHIGVSGVLVGGHAFDLPKERLLPWVYATGLTGLVLVFLEAFPRAAWFHQGRGVMVVAKLALLLAIPRLWSYRVALLAAVIVLASVGSHMPARFRYYSVLYRRVLD